jgi:hypothetical protein
MDKCKHVDRTLQQLTARAAVGPCHVTATVVGTAKRDVAVTKVHATLSAQRNAAKAKWGKDVATIKGMQESVARIVGTFPDWERATSEGPRLVPGPAAVGVSSAGQNSSSS